MDRRAEFIATCDAHLRLVRLEAGLTQEAMAQAVGLSKKTLVDIEKGRRSLGWSGAVTLCAVFPASTVVAVAFGGAPLDMVPALAQVAQPARPIPGANPWWEVVADNGSFVIEQNVISQHYRLLTKDRAKVAASFDLDDLLPLLNGEKED